ncbi:MAG: multiprotein bridging factor aMBF1 [Conexivisphaerales archaeon]
MVKCEVCGGNIYGDPLRVEIDDAILLVCSKCAKLGKPVRESIVVQQARDKEPAVARVYRRVNDIIPDEDLNIREDYASVIKNARQSMNLTQEQLGMKVNEKSSVIAKLESGKLKPSIQLAKKLEHVMHIRLFDREE